MGPNIDFIKIKKVIYLIIFNRLIILNCVKYVTIIKKRKFEINYTNYY